MRVISSRSSPASLLLSKSKPSIFLFQNTNNNNNQHYKRHSSAAATSTTPSSSSSTPPPRINRSLLRTDDLEWKEMTGTQKVVRSGKMLGYSGVILAGLTLMSAAGYFVSQEMITTWRDNSMYEETLELVKNNEKVQKELGSPILGQHEMKWDGERRRRRQLRAYEANSNQQDQKFLRMRFTISGSLQPQQVSSSSSPPPPPAPTATVFVEKVEQESGSWKYNLVSVELASTGKRILVVDNRAAKPSAKRKTWFSGFSKKRTNQQQVQQL